jgi:type IV pilus assembly protein PilV
MKHLSSIHASIRASNSASNESSNRTGRRRGGQGGLTLIEVLVAILIFSFGLLGFVGLQARAIQYSAGAEDSNRAALLANELASQMLTAQTANLPTTTITDWQARVSDATVTGLPNGAGTVSTTGNVATITLTWQPPSAISGAANSVNQYVTQVIIP